MKKLLPFSPPLRYLRREPLEGVAAPAETRRPFRLWMTGSLAVVMAAIVPLRSEFDRSQAQRLLRPSRYDVSETLQRIELAARDRGLSVLARVPGVPTALVLASSLGGTPVVMDEADSTPAMPLGLMLRPAGAGGTEVLIERLPAGAWAEMPAGVVDDVRALPVLVERALA